MRPDCVSYTTDGYAIYSLSPGTSKPYGYDFRSWLNGSGINQANTDVTVPSELTKGALHFDPAGHVGVWLSNNSGVIGERYQCTVHIETDEVPPRIDDRTFVIELRQQ